MKNVYIHKQEESQEVHKTKEVADGVMIDFDEEGNVLGVEVLDVFEVNISEI